MRSVVVVLSANLARSLRMVLSFLLWLARTHWCFYEVMARSGYLVLSMGMARSRKVVLFFFVARSFVVVRLPGYGSLGLHGAFHSLG